MSLPLGVLATIVPMLVPAVEQLLLLAAGEIKPDKPLPIPPRRRWLRLYRSSHRTNRVLTEVLGIDLAGWDGRAATIAGDETYEVPLRLDPLREFLRCAFEESTDEDVSASLARFCRTHEFGFVATVWLPAVMLYGAPPSLLLRRARQGDDTALQALLRLDKSAVFDPVIALRWHEATRDHNASRVQATLAAMAGRPHRRFSAKSIRVTLAGGLVKLFERAGMRLTSTQLRYLFAEVTPSGTLLDVDMPEGDALTKALQREKRPRQAEAAVDGRVMDINS